MCCLLLSPACVAALGHESSGSPLVEPRPEVRVTVNLVLILRTIYAFDEASTNDSTRLILGRRTVALQ